MKWDADSQCSVISSGVLRVARKLSSECVGDGYNTRINLLTLVFAGQQAAGLEQVPALNGRVQGMGMGGQNAEHSTARQHNDEAEF